MSTNSTGVTDASPGQRWRALGVWIGVAAAIVLLFYELRTVLTPFFLAGVMAYMLEPVVRKLRRWRVPRTLAVLLAMLLVLALLVLLVLIVLPLFVTEIQQLVRELPGWLERLNTHVAPWLNARLGTNIRLDPVSIKEAITDALQTSEGLGGRLLTSLRMGGLGLLGLFANAVLVPVVLFFVLRDWPRIIRQSRSLIPRRWKAAVVGLLREADYALGQYLHGQMLVIGAMALFYTLGLWLTGLTYFLPIGILTGLLVFVPYVGAATGFILATVAALMQFDTPGSVVWVWVVFVTGQIIEGNFATPKLVGERIGLHPIAVIFALLAFGQLFGFTGLLVALPASAVLLVALRHMRTQYFASDLYRNHH